MKRIGIVTLYPAKDNYGQLLQAYALQTFLKKLGYDVFLIRYCKTFTLRDEKGIRKIVKAVYLFLRKMLFIDKLHYTNVIDDLSIKHRDFENFYNTHFQFSDILYTSIEQIQVNPPKADIYIAGSDQIWNWGGRYGYDKVFFLQFGKEKIKRIVYAAGMSYIVNTLNAVEELNQYLRNIDMVSLREPTGIPLLKQAGCKNPSVVLDPTLLLQKNDYMYLTKSIEIPSTNYMLGYFINFQTIDDIAWIQIEKYIAETNIDFKYVSSSGYLPAINVLGIYENQYYTTPDWIAAIQYAQCVLTSSYHGLLFAIIMEKPFLFFFVKNKHSYGQNRGYHILKELGLESRIYRESESLSFKEQLQCPIDWTNVNEKLKKLQKLSTEFLITAIESEK